MAPSAARACVTPTATSTPMTKEAEAIADVCHAVGAVGAAGGCGAACGDVVGENVGVAEGVGVGVSDDDTDGERETVGVALRDIETGRFT